MLLRSRLCVSCSGHAERIFVRRILKPFKFRRGFLLAFPSSHRIKCNTIIAGIVCGSIISGCSGPSEPTPTSGRPQSAERTSNAAEPSQRLSASEEQAKDEENKAWAEAVRARTAAAMNEFLRHHESGAHAAEARQRLAVLEKDEENKAWAEAFRAGTAAAMNEFLRHHESGARAAEARRRLAVLEQSELWEQEKKAWAEASRAGTVTALREFLQHHGSGARASMARQRLSALERQARWEEENARMQAALPETPAKVEPEAGPRLPPVEVPREEPKIQRKPRVSSSIRLPSINI